MRLTAFARSTIATIHTALSLALFATAAAAQVPTGTIRGTVTEAGSNRPVPDAQVLIPGTTRGAVTNTAGEYVIVGVPAGAQQLRARRLGFSASSQTVTVTAGETTRADFAIRTTPTDLGAVVVTGTAGAVEKRTIGNAITQVDVTELNQKSSLANVSDVLQSTTPGLTLVPGSGTPGTAADIRIRGTSSISASNRPIFYIDGIRYNDGPQGSYGPSGTGATGNTFSQGVSALDAINPADIERIEVIKGPAASTLYGADAAGGVIQIITKKGSRTQKPSWTVRGDYGNTNWALPTGVNYTTCTSARVADTLNWPGCASQTAGAVLSDDPLRRDPSAMRTGKFENFVGSVRGGGDRYSYYVSGDRSLDQGVFYNSFNNRKSGRGNFSYNLSDKLDIAVNTSYIQTWTRLPLSDDAGGGLIISAVRGQPGRRTNRAPGFAINSPEVANQYDNQTRAERTILGGTANWRPLSWLRSRMTVGMDNNSARATVYYAPGSLFSQGDFPGGYIAERLPQTHLYTFDFASTASTRLRSSLTSDLSMGVQGNKADSRRIEATGAGLPSPDFQLVGSATTVSGSTGYSQQSSLGYYVQEQLGWANRLFLTGAVRADDNSAFGTTFNRVYYPKASLAYVASEAPTLAPLFRAIHADNFKLRAAYGQAGHAPGPYDALRTYGATKVITGANTATSGLVAGAPGNAGLRAERGTETELGFDASFFSGRAGIEFTRYRKVTTDALLSIANAPSLGFTGSRYVNFGALQNTGNELALTLRPVQLNTLAWDAQLNYSTNTNRLNKLNYLGITSLAVYDPYLGVTAQRIVEGYPVAGWWATDAKRNPDGSFLLSPTGAVQADTTLRYVGPSTPRYEGSVANTFTVARNIRLYALIDFKGGYYVLNQRDRNRAQVQLNSKEFNNGTLSSTDSSYLRNAAITKPWIQPGDFVKLRDVSASLTLPAGFARTLRVAGATLTVAGRNLGFISKKYGGLDPEVNFIGQSTFLSGASNFIQFLRVDSYTQPMLRRWTTSLTLTF